MSPSSVSLGTYSRPHVTQTAEDGPPFLCVGFDAQSFKPIDHADMVARVLPQLLQWPAATIPLLVP